MPEISCKDMYNPFSRDKYIWYCCNGETVKHFESFVEAMDFCIQNEGWWIL